MAGDRAFSFAWSLLVTLNERERKPDVSHQDTTAQEKKVWSALCLPQNLSSS
jgi:hypothetical protein